jgi:dihydropteroate synthase
MIRNVEIMGILNVTPDSFHDGGNYINVEDAVRRAHQIASEGADIIDVGGESTRPGSKSVSAQEEIERVCPVIETIASELDLPISVDTRKSGVAEAAVRAGATIINDISGLTFDEKIAGIAAEYSTGLVLMHIKGTPENMQVDPVYDDLIGEISDFLRIAREKAVDAGVERTKIILDPGIGFGKTLEDNYKILNNIQRFRELGSPLLIGLSNKSLIGRLYSDNPSRLPGTIALNTVSILNGADMIRVHHVKEHRLALDALMKLMEVAG